MYPTNQRAYDSINNYNKHFDKDCESWVTVTAYDAKRAAEKKKLRQGRFQEMAQGGFIPPG